MLVRTFRLTDKLSNAFLRLSIWFGDALLSQVYRLRLALVSSLEALWFTVSQTLQSGRVIYQSSEERRRALMARRAAEATSRPVIREDPLKTQNRALSMFTVVLMGALILMVLWFTSTVQLNATAPRVAGGPILGLQTKTAPTPFPTIIPTSTAVPDPLQSGGSIVYAMRDRGHDNLWALGIGQTTPIRLTNTTADDRDPVWSPDGSKIAFASHRDGNWELYVMDVGTGNTSRLTYDLNYEGAPTWSPDGRYIAYESYENNNLDIHIIAADGSKTVQLTYNAAPDFAPAWSPNGRQIAYISLRDNNQEIYIINLDNPSEDKALRFTITSDIEEETPSWSPDGQTLAYSARINGMDLIFTKSLNQPDAAPATIGQGRQPVWSPNGSSLLFAVDNGPATTLVGGQIGTVGVSALAISIPSRANHPSWTGALLPTSLVQQAGPRNAAEISPLFKEQIHFESPNPPFNRLALLSGVTAPNAALSDKVDDSFIALRAAMVQEAGFDFLGNLKDALWGVDRLPDPGQSRQSWHYAGRAVDFDRNLVFGDSAPIEVVREDSGVNTYWRVYIRVPNELQGGQLGEPLKKLPWDFASRNSGDPQALEQGGRKKSAVPAGYYVDFTRIAEDYGWMRVSSERTWRSVYNGILYWEYDKRENLTWADAMLQLYSKDELTAFLSGPTFVPTPIPQPTEPERKRTPTPLPPDAKPGS